MTTQIGAYLSDLGRRLHLEPRKEREILHELQAHVEDKTQELIEDGVPSGEALAHAINDLGSPDEIATQFYEVHSQGSWYHTTLAVLPHLLLAAIFFLHLWTDLIWTALLLAVAIVIAYTAGGGAAQDGPIHGSGTAWCSPSSRGGWP